MSKKELGQYFTVDPELQKYVHGITKNKGGLLLEPSFGAGHLLKLYLASNPDYPMVCCEVDKKIVPCVTFTDAQKVIYGDFMKTEFTGTFKSIIGNPPYVKVEKGKNLYLQFIDKCLGLLAEDGELIFIVPSDFLKLTSAAELIRKMVGAGSFTDFLFPEDEKLFIDSVVDVVVFRYQKGIKCNDCIRNGVATKWTFNMGIISFNSSDAKAVPLDQLFDCYVGFVSGLDSVFCNDLGKLEVLCDKDKVKKFICVDAFPTGVKAVDDHLNLHKKALTARKIKKFGDENWFTWGAIRNKAAIDERKDRDCIYVRTMTRKADVAFIGKVQYFSGALLCLVPKVDGLDLVPIVKALNSSDVKKDYLYSGRFKIGQKQLRFVRI
jgi:adenine-specific DNA-methyltransferase